MYQMIAGIEQVPRQTQFTHPFGFNIDLSSWYGKCWWLTHLCSLQLQHIGENLPVLVELSAYIFHCPHFYASCCSRDSCWAMTCMLLLYPIPVGLNKSCEALQKHVLSSKGTLKVSCHLFIQTCSLIAGHEAVICFKHLVCEIPECCFFSPFHFPFKC